MGCMRMELELLENARDTLTPMISTPRQGRPGGRRAQHCGAAGDPFSRFTWLDVQGTGRVKIPRLPFGISVARVVVTSCDV